MRGIGITRARAVAGDKAADEIFHSTKDRQFGRARCFLCGVSLNKKNRTEEHVVPRWAQRRFGLYNQQFRLLNGTCIHYRELTIPCCLNCNAKYLKPIEDKMAKATLKGPAAVGALGELTLFVWLGKIFYGLLYKELLLLRNRASKTKVPIVKRQLLKTFDLHQVFLQSARLPMNFVPAPPTSIFVFKIAEVKDNRLQWDFRDSPQLMTVSCRIGRTGILAALQDGGAQRDTKALAWRSFRRLELQPFHFVELTAAFFYAARLMNRVPKFMIMYDTPVLVVQNPLQGFSLKPIFDEWNQYEFARVLAGMTGYPLEEIFSPPTGVVSWLHDVTGKIKLQPVPELAPIP
jgi:hypothetical protein